MIRWKRLFPLFLGAACPVFLAGCHGSRETEAFQPPETFDAVSYTHLFSQDPFKKALRDLKHKNDPQNDGHRRLDSGKARAAG